MSVGNHRWLEKFRSFVDRISVDFFTEFANSLLGIAIILTLKGILLNNLIPDKGKWFAILTSLDLGKNKYCDSQNLFRRVFGVGIA